MTDGARRPVLVTGARGQVGRLVLAGLLAAGVPVRVSSRRPQPEDFPAGVDAVRMDLADRATLAPALAGVDKVFLYAESETAGAFAEAALGAGVRHVVLLSSASVIEPEAAASPIAARHLAVERALGDAGIDRTFVRPAYFATNALRWQTIRTERVLRTAFPEATTSMVHERDIADVALASLLDDSHIGATHAVLGAGLSSTRAQVAAIADALGEEVRCEEIDVQTYRSEQLAVLPPPIVDLLLSGRGNVEPPPAELASDAVPDVVGRPALTFSEWARDHVADFR